MPDGPVDAAVVRVLLQALAAQQKELLELREGQKRAQRDLDAVKRRLAVSERNVDSVSSAFSCTLMPHLYDDCLMRVELQSAATPVPERQPLRRLRCLG